MTNNFDFEIDLREILTQQLRSFEIKVSEKRSFHLLIIDFLTLQRKLIKPIPRQVLVSSELQKKMSSLAQRDTISLLVERIEKGLDVNHFQSDKLYQTQMHDQLLYEWNIRHFHLSTKKYKKNFLKRTSLLLYVYFTNEKAILLDVDSHDDEIFASVKWLEILHDNFPEEIKQFIQSEDIIPVGKNLSDLDRKKMWDKGFSPLLTRVRDVIYTSPGVGRMTSGHSALVVGQANELYRWVCEANQQFKDHFSAILEHEKPANNVMYPKLKIVDRTLTVVDEKTQQVYLKCPVLYQITPILK